MTFRDLLTEGTLTTKQVAAVRDAVKSHNSENKTQLVGAEVLTYVRKLKPYSIVFKYLKDPSNEFYKAIKKFNSVNESKEPKTFWIHRPKPNSKKWEVTSKRVDPEVIEVSINSKNYTIEFNGESQIYVSDVHGIEWTNWDWGDFAANSGKKIEAMIKYLKGLES